MRILFLLTILSAILIMACSPVTPLDGEETIKDITDIQDTPEDQKTMDDEIKTDRSGKKYLIDPKEFRSGGPGLGGIGERGGIASLLDPTFISAEEATFLPDNELVLGIDYKGETRAYPYRILVWHEIANDIIQGDPILVTFCPLCFTGVAFHGEIDGQRELFGVSGKLYNSELVMYDQSTKSYWPQSLGKAVVGPRTGLKLEKIPIDVARWGDWKATHPETKVLSQNTGFLRNYGDNPYGKDGDFADISIRIGVRQPDIRLPAQEIVHGLEIDDTFKAYTDSKVREQKVINDQLGGKNIAIWLDPRVGSIRAFNRDIGGQTLTFSSEGDTFVDNNGNSWDPDGKNNGQQLERLVVEPIFWFAWAAFYPETSLFK